MMMMMYSTAGSLWSSRRLSTYFLIIYIVCSHLVAANNEEIDQDKCEIKEYCRLCSDSDKKTIDGCAQTGKIQAMQCAVIDDDSEEDFEQKQTIYSSCYRTKEDDEFLLVRFQAMCILFGGLACLSSKKQKTLSATLFDQRKQKTAEKPKKRVSEIPSDLEMPELAGRGELDALTANDSLEVV